jgi:hypothetical protein
VAVVRAVALIAAGLAALVWLIPAAPMTGDGQHYIEFVRNGLQHGASSWHERRLLGPLLVRAMPLDAQDGFFVLTVASLAVTALLTWLAAREVLAGDESRALAAIPLLFGTWVVAPNLREFGLIDPLAWAFVAGVWLATVRKQWWLAAATAAVGVVAKEVVALAALAAAAAAFDARRLETRPNSPSDTRVGRDRRVSRRSLFERSSAELLGLAVGVAAPAVVVVAGLTLVFPGSGTDAGAYVLKWLRDGLLSNGPGRAAFLFFASYGALWLLAPRAWAALPGHLKRAAVVYGLAAVALPLVGSPERMEEAIFPVMVTGAVLATRAWSVATLWALALGGVLFAARVGGDARLPTVLAWSGLVVACALAVWGSLVSRPAPRLVRAGLPGTTARSR